MGRLGVSAAAPVGWGLRCGHAPTPSELSPAPPAEQGLPGRAERAVPAHGHHRDPGQHGRRDPVPLRHHDGRGAAHLASGAGQSLGEPTPKPVGGALRGVFGCPSAWPARGRGGKCQGGSASPPLTFSQFQKFLSLSRPALECESPAPEHPKGLRPPSRGGSVPLSGKVSRGELEVAVPKEQKETAVPQPLCSPSHHGG